MTKTFNSAVTVVYRETGIPHYDGNRFIESLPPIVDSVTGIKSLKAACKFNAEDRQKPKSSRSHMIAQIMNDFFQPLSQHVLLYEKISMMIRSGYVGRNPDTGALQKHLQNGYERLQSGELEAVRFSDAKSTAQSMLLIGVSGCGKSTSLDQILSGYPQVIYHPELNFNQVVYLKVNCPHNGSLKELCLNFFSALDKATGQNYLSQYGFKRHTTETLQAIMSQLANSLAVGLLVIDEIQSLSRVRSGGREEMLNFFVTLVNTIGVPVLLVGTPKAREIFEGEMAAGRRASGFGSIYWDPIPQFKQGTLNPEWSMLAQKLWSQQLLINCEPSPSNEFLDVWYELSQGIIDIVVKLFVFTQLLALANGSEKLTVNQLKEVYKTEFKPVHPMIKALQSGMADKIAKYSDLRMPDIDRRILEIHQKIVVNTAKTPEEVAFSILRTTEEQRFFTMLNDGKVDPIKLAHVVQAVFATGTKLTRVDKLALIEEQLKGEPVSLEPQSKPDKAKSIKVSEWKNLKDGDLRFVKSQCETAQEVYEALQKQNLIFDMQEYLQAVS